ncbi:MAG: hypothetical protein NVS3B25_35370 [Hymenobacter sp.]
MSLYHLLYQSQALAAFSARELIELLQKSWAYNTTHGLTGILLHAPNGQFLQVLEGEEATVQHLYYDRIATDPRHEHLVVLSEGPSATQVFSDWCMSFHSEYPLSLPGYLAPGATYSRMSRLTEATPELLQLLRDFAQGYDDNPLSRSLVGIKR